MQGHEWAIQIAVWVFLAGVAWSKLASHSKEIDAIKEDVDKLEVAMDHAKDDRARILEIVGRIDERMKGLHDHICAQCRNEGKDKHGKI